MDCDTSYTCNDVGLCARIYKIAALFDKIVQKLGLDGTVAI
jgi:hypothetical protein